MQKLTGEERSYYIENFQIEDFFSFNIHPYRNM